MKKPTLMMIIVTVFALLASLAFADHHAIKIVKQESQGNFLTETKGMAGDVKGHGAKKVWLIINPENFPNR